MTRTVPQVVTQITPNAMVQNFVGAWSATVTYSAGQWVTSAEELWLALKPNEDSEPTAANANWAVIGSIA